MLHDLVLVGFDHQQLPPGLNLVVDAFDGCFAILTTATATGALTCSASRLKPARSLCHT